MDFRFALRSIARRPAFALVIMATMTVGIGANTAMFGVIRAVFLRPLPYPDPDRLVTVWESDPERGVSQRRLTAASFVDWEAQNTVIEAMGALPNWTGQAWLFNVVAGDSIERVPGIYASSGFFRVLQTTPLLGRTLTIEDDRQQGLRNVVISYDYWRARFGADRSAIGRTLEIDTFRGGAFTVAGVMPEAFDFPHGAKLWLSLADWGGGPMPAVDSSGGRGGAWYTTFARLRPRVTLERAAAELTAIARRVSAHHPQSARVTEVRVIPLRETLVGRHRLALLALFGAVGCVLLIGCANVANLFLSRSVTRRDEIHTRIALGATRGRIARQLVSESLLVCAPGAAAALIAAAWAERPLARALGERIPLAAGSRLDWTVFVFAALLTVGCAAICGLAPLVEWRAADGRGRGQSEGAASKRLRHALVGGEVALAVALVATAGLLIRTLAKLEAIDAGFSTERTLVVSLDVTTAPLRGRGNSARFLEELLPRLSALPGVRTIAATTSMPFENGEAEQPITREGKPALPASQSPRVLQTAVTPGYFAAMGLALSKGRPFREADAADASLVAILNETAARRYWPDEDPIGKRFAIGSLERFGSFRRPPPGGIEWREIVGVAADARSSRPGLEVQPEVYYNYRQFPLYEPKLLVRTAGDPIALAQAVRREITSTSSRAVVTAVRTLDQVASEAVAEPRLRAALAGSFSGVAVLLGMLGIHGVMSYTVAQRTREIGIRMALGARGADVARMVIAQALGLTGLGLAVGIAAAHAAARSISSLLFGVEPTDPITLAGTCLLLAAVALLASYVPARRAMRVDPAAALRTE